MQNNFVSICKLDTSDEEFHFKDHKGRSPRALIEQVDGDRYFFPSVENAYAFARIHGMQPVCEKDMDRLRSAEKL